MNALSADEKEVVQLFRAFATSHKEAPKLRFLVEDYTEIEGRRPDPGRFRNILELLRASGEFNLTPMGADTIVTARLTADSAHIVEMIRAQTKKKARKSNTGYGSFRGGRGGSRGGRSSFMPPRPANFSGWPRYQPATSIARQIGPPRGQSFNFSALPKLHTLPAVPPGCSPMPKTVQIVPRSAPVISNYKQPTYAPVAPKIIQLVPKPVPVITQYQQPKLQAAPRSAEILPSQRVRKIEPKPVDPSPIIPTEPEKPKVESTLPAARPPIIKTKSSVQDRLKIVRQNSEVVVSFLRLFL